MDMKESFKYRYNVEWDEFEDRNVKFLWVLIWEHATQYQKKIDEQKLQEIKTLINNV